MADPNLQNKKRQGLDQTWKEAYQDVNKTAASIRDLNEDFADFVQNYYNFSDTRRERFLDLLKGLDDVSDHWKEINDWIKENTDSVDDYVGSLSEIRDIFRDVSDTLGGTRRQISDTFSLVRKVENIARDAVDVMKIEGGLTERDLTRQIKKSQILSSQLQIRVKSLAPEFDIEGSLENQQDILNKAREKQRAALKDLEKEVRRYDKIGDFPGKQSILKSLNEEIKLRNLNLTLLSNEYIAASRELPDRLKERKGLWREQRTGAGENGVAVQKIDLASKALKTVGLKDQAADLEEAYGEWVTDRVDAEEKVKLAEHRLASVAAEIKNLKEDLKNTKLDILGDTLTEKVTNVFKSEGGEQFIKDLERLQDLENLDLGNLGIDGKNIPDEQLQAFLDEYETLEAKLRNTKELGKLTPEQLKNVKEYGLQWKALGSEVDKAREAVDKAKENRDIVFGVKFNTKLEDLKESFRSLEGIKKLLGAIAFLLAGLMWKQLLKFDEEAVKTKRVIGQWADASALANTKFVTGTEVLKTMRDLGEQFHINPVQVFSPEELGRISQAQKLTGMTAQAAGNLAIQSKITGKNADTYRDSIADGAYQARLVNRQALNLNAVQNDVLTTSRAIALSYGKNTEGLARAAGAAAALGTNLQGVEDIAKNLMNFESSIESEMQAQLLTGMQLNLAKAREYALNNDLEGVAREVGRQGMDAAKFSHMNYIQQENMAKALGMSREQMSKMLIMQEISKGLSAAEIANRTGMRRQDIEALSAQEKWQTMKQKFLESLVPLLEPVLQLTSDILIPVTKFVLGPITWLVGQISRLGGLIKEDNKTLREIIGLIAIAIPAAVFRLGAFGKIFRGIFTGVGKIGKGIAGWVTNLISARKAAAATDVVFGKSINRWRNIKTGRIAKTPVAPQSVGLGGVQRDYAGRTAKQRLRDVRKLERTKTINPKGAAATSKATTSMGSSISKLGKNIGTIALGAAAAVLIAGAVFILAKAAQEFAKIDNLGKALLGAGAALIGLTATVALLGVVMSSGIGTALVLAGAAAMLVMAGAVGILGLALKQFEGLNWETLGKLPVAMLSLAAAGALALAAGPALALAAPALLVGSTALIVASVPLTVAGTTLTAASKKLVKAGVYIKVAFENLSGITFTAPDLSELKKFSSDLRDVDIPVKTVRRLARALAVLSGIPAGITISVPDLSGLRRFSEDLQNVNVPVRTVRQVATALRSLAGLPAVHIVIPDLSNLRRFSEDLENVNISGKSVRKIARAFRKLGNLDAGQSTGRTVARLEKLASLNTGLDATATALVKVGSAVGSLASNLEGLDMTKLAKISRRFLGLSRIAPVNLRANLRVPEQTENTGESLGKSRENIETAVREVTVKQVESRASAQRVSVDQKTADLSKIEKKLDNVITAIKNSTPKDWNWLEFNRTQAANM